MQGDYQRGYYNKYTREKEYCASNIPLCLVPGPCKRIIKTAYASQKNLEIPELIQLDMRGKAWPSNSAQ